MRNRTWALPVVWMLLCLGFLGAGWGCSKRAVSSSGDQASVARPPAPVFEPAPAPPVETIKPEPIVTVPIPDEKPVPPAPIETAREPETAPEPLVSPEPPTVPPREPTLSRPAPPAVPPPPTVPMAPAAVAAASDHDLEDIYFDYDRYVIRGDAQPVLESNAGWIKSHAGKPIVIEGHCDERGTLAYNLVLGEKRARAAKRYLEDLGVPASRLKIVSYGEVRPLCKDYEESCWQKNRRAHFVPQ